MDTVEGRLELPLFYDFDTCQECGTCLYRCQVMGLTPEQAITVVETARQEWEQIVGGDQHLDRQAEEVVVQIEIVGDEMHLHCPTPEIAAKIEAGRDRLERILAGLEAEEPEPFQIIDPPPPCPRCGSLRLWEGGDGTWHCLRCDPPLRAERLAAKAARLRRQSDPTPRKGGT